MSILPLVSRRTSCHIGDPRSYQIAVLAVLLVYGVTALALPIRWTNAAALLLGAQLAQFFGARCVAGVRFDPASALITTLSLTLLLRTDSVVLAMLAGFVAIGSKFLIRVRGKHVFNPSNFALVAMTLATNHAWLSSGQWGSATLGALALACLGFLVLTRARRAETTIAFLVTFAALLGAVARGSAGDTPAPARERRIADLRVLHDLRSEDDTGQPLRQDAVRRGRRLHRVRHPVRPV